MKKSLILILLFLVVGFTQAQDTAKKMRVAVLLYPGVELVDFAGPTDVFIKANAMTRGKYEVYSIAFEKEPVQTQGGGPFLQPTYTVASMPKPDILVIPGAAMEVIDSLKKDARLIGFLKKYLVLGWVLVVRIPAIICSLIQRRQVVFILMLIRC